MPKLRQCPHDFFDEVDVTYPINAAIIQDARITTNSDDSVRVLPKNTCENNQKFDWKTFLCLNLYMPIGYVSFGRLQ